MSYKLPSTACLSRGLGFLEQPHPAVPSGAVLLPLCAFAGAQSDHLLFGASDLVSLHNSPHPPLLVRWPLVNFLSLFHHLTWVWGPQTSFAHPVQLSGVYSMLEFALEDLHCHTPIPHGPRATKSMTSVTPFTRPFPASWLNLSFCFCTLVVICTCPYFPYPLISLCMYL